MTPEPRKPEIETFPAAGDPNLGPLKGRKPEPRQPFIETLPDQSGEFDQFNIFEAGRTGKGKMKPRIPDKPPKLFNSKTDTGKIEKNTEWMNSDERKDLIRQRNKGLSITPAHVPYWNAMQHERPINGRPRRSNGLTGKKKRYFEWDREHRGEIEVYDHTGKRHIGAMDPLTQEFKKGPDSGREIGKTSELQDKDDNTRPA